MIRYFYLIVGILFVAVGIVGLFLPLLPMTPFLLVAAACFARSSQRLENKLLAHPRFGPLLRAWRERQAIPVGAKLLALGGCVSGFILFLLAGPPSLPLILAVAVLMGVGLAYVFSRPSA